MNELDDSAPVIGSFVQAESDRLPDLNIDGYQVCAQLSEHRVRSPSGDRTTYLAQALDRYRSWVDDKYHLQFQHRIPARTDPKLMLWLRSMVEPNPQHRLALISNRESAPLERPNLSANLSQEHPQLNLAFNLSKPPPKVRWLRWAIALGALITLVLIGRQILSPGEEELSPAQIAKNQSIAQAAAFAASDRGRLLKENRCDGCNLNYQNFSKAELTGAIVPQSSAIGANFAGANLTLAMFRDTNLSRANLSRANLDRAALYGAKLIGTNLVGANLHRAKLVYAKLTGAAIHDANLANSDRRFAEFQQADLTNTNLTSADLSNANLSAANLRHTKLDGAKLDGAILTGATMPDGSTHP